MRIFYSSQNMVYIVTINLRLSIHPNRIVSKMYSSELCWYVLLAYLKIITCITIKI